ncbi:unnamed protein product [Closterium sp. NIES-54]
MHSLHLPPALLPPAGAAAGGAGAAGAVAGGGGVGGGEAGSSAALGKFVKKASHAVQAVLKAQCSNGARERRMLAKLLPDWSHLLSLDQTELAAVKTALGEKLAMKDLGKLTNYLGMEITRDRTARTITLSQKFYINNVLTRYLDSVLATLIHNVSAREASLQKPFTAPSSRKARRKPVAVPPPSPPPPSLDLALITAYQLLCKAYVRVSQRSVSVVPHSTCLLPQAFPAPPHLPCPPPSFIASLLLFLPPRTLSILLHSFLTLPTQPLLFSKFEISVPHSHFPHFPLRTPIFPLPPTSAFLLHPPSLSSSRNTLPTPHPQLLSAYAFVLNSKLQQRHSPFIFSHCPLTSLECSRYSPTSLPAPHPQLPAAFVLDAGKLNQRPTPLPLRIAHSPP